MSYFQKTAVKALNRLRGKSTGKNLGVWPPGEEELYHAQFGRDAVEQRLFYDVGAGVNFRHPAWQNVGLPSERYGEEHLDLVWDLQALEPMPVPDNAAQIVYSRYTLEHVTDEAVQNFFHEAYRALRPGGVLRVIVPDIEVYYRAYLAEDGRPFFKPKRDTKQYPNKMFKMNPNNASFEQRFLWAFASSASKIHQMEVTERISDAELRKVLNDLPFEQALDYCTAKCSLEFQRKHPQFHINWFNTPKLERMMRSAGYINPYKSGAGESRIQVLRNIKFFDNRRPEIGLFMEANK